MKTVGLRRELFVLVLTVISIFVFRCVSYAADNNGNLNNPSISIIQKEGNSTLGCFKGKNEHSDVQREVDENFVSSSPAIVAYSAFSGVEVNTNLVHIPLTTPDATTLIVTFRSSQEMPLNEVEWKLFKYNEALDLRQYDSRKINYNDFELDPSSYYFASWTSSPGEGDKPLVEGLYLCKVTVKAKNSTLRSTVKFKFEVE
ncbi:MAG: hypothetical protein CV087_04180 [Candidatus Brocadia sp. WS118]|nr:MAG: hypothetical protein CV087_04180 [Candidatus Brocadia sp. WS118]